MDQVSAEEFRLAAASYNRDRRKPGWRYPAELRRIAMTYCEARRRAGVQQGEIAKELGIPSTTLSGWFKAEAVGVAVTAPVARFHPIVVRPVEEVASSSLRVITPGGLRIEGLGLGQLFELVRAVG